MNHPNKSSESVTRRHFLQTSGLAVGGAVASSLVVPRGVFAAGADTMKVALIGCGGRGNGALGDCMNAAKEIGLNLKLVATADAFKDRAVGADPFLTLEAPYSPVPLPGFSRGGDFSPKLREVFREPCLARIVTP